MSRSTYTFGNEIVDDMDCLDLSQDILLSSFAKNCLDVHSDISETEQNLTVKKNESMVIEANKLPSFCPIDTKLENQMKFFGVSNQIKSQVLNGLATEKKQQLLSKYNASTLSPTTISTQTSTNNYKKRKNQRLKLMNSNSHISSIFDADIDSAFDSYELDIELLDLLKANCMPLTSLQKLKKVPNWKKTQYINTLKRRLDISTSHTFDNDADMESMDVNRGSPMLYYQQQNREDYNTKTCLRCLKEINKKNKDGKCRFHAFATQKANNFMNIQYFMQRNAELDGIGNFCFSCCHRKCVGYFGPDSQRNGCYVVNGHLFECNDEQKELNNNEEDIDQIEVDLCGKWKVMLWIENRVSLFKICDVEIIKHTKSGHIEGYLVGSLYIDSNKYENGKKQIYSGQLSGDQLMLTYRQQSRYLESYILFVENYQLNGNWIASTKKRGTCQWMKIAPLLKKGGILETIPIER